MVIDEDRFMKLYREGLSDVKIAKRLGCRAQKVRKLRKKLGLPSNWNVTWRVKALRIIEALRNGRMSAKELSEIAGIRQQDLLHYVRRANELLNPHFEIRRERNGRFVMYYLYDLRKKEECCLKS